MVTRMTAEEEQQVKRSNAFAAYQAARERYDRCVVDLRTAEANLKYASTCAREAHADLMKTKKVLDETMTIPLMYGDAVTMGIE